jgi:hypothetical protein
MSGTHTSGTRSRRAMSASTRVGAIGLGRQRRDRRDLASSPAGYPQPKTARRSCTRTAPPTATPTHPQTSCPRPRVPLARLVTVRPFGFRSPTRHRPTSCLGLVTTQDKSGSLAQSKLSSAPRVPRWDHTFMTSSLSPINAIEGYLAEYNLIGQGIRQDQQERHGFLAFSMAASGLIWAFSCVPGHRARLPKFAS